MFFLRVQFRSGVAQDFIYETEVRANAARDHIVTCQVQGQSCQIADAAGRTCDLVNIQEVDALTRTDIETETKVVWLIAQLRNNVATGMEATVAPYRNGVGEPLDGSPQVRAS